MKKSKSIAKAILLCVFLAVFSSNASAQKVTLSFQNETFEKVLSAIKKQTSLSLVFSEQLVDLNRKVSINVNSFEVEDALKQLLTGTNIGFEIKNKKLYLVEKKTDESKDVHIKSGKITGMVTDQNGVPVIGATVIEKGTKKGTITDVNGKFTIDSEGDAIFKISYIGYQAKEIPLNHQRELRVMLNEDAKSLEEVVVVGYGTQKKRDVTGSVSIIKSTDLNSSSASNFAQELQGKAAGVQVTQSTGQPGANVKIQLRSNPSNANAGVLYVIDGVPVNDNAGTPSSAYYGSSGVDQSPLNFINPNDIESISFLKDASSASIYGARAGAGVVLITTKRGISNSPKVTYSTSYGVQQADKMFELLNTQDYMNQANLIGEELWMKNNKIAPYYGTVNSSTVTPYVPVYTQEQMANTPNYPSALKAIFRDGYTLQHNVSITGGNGKTSYFVSGNYYNQTGTIIGSGLKRYNGKINFDQYLSPAFKFGVSIIASNSTNQNVTTGGANQSGGIVTAAIYYPANQPLQSADGTYLINQKFPNIPNPLSFNTVTDFTDGNRLLTSAYAEWQLIKGLTAKANFSYDQSANKRNSYYPTTFLYGAQANGIAGINQTSQNTNLTEWTLNYNKTLLNNKLGLNLLAGYSNQITNWDGVNAGNQNFISDNLSYYNLGAGQALTPTVGSTKSQKTWASYFARGSFSWESKYIVQASIRRDGASNFAENKKWGYFPSVSGSWVISEEEFIKSISVISNLKLRAGFGETGNSNFGGTAFEVYGLGAKPIFGTNTTSTGIYLNQAANPNLTWETAAEINGGLDLGLFKNRITVSFDIFSKTISNLISWIPLPADNIVSGVWGNAGTTRSQGYEFSIQSRNFVAKMKGDFTWTTTINLSHYLNYWVERSAAALATLPKYVAATGTKALFNGYYGYQADGLFKGVYGTAPATMPGMLPGGIIIKDIHGYDATGNLTGSDGKITSADQTLLFNWDPTLSFGFGNSFTFKNFDLNVFFSGAIQKGLDSDAPTGIYRMNLVQDNLNAFGWNESVTIKDRWTFKNTNTNRPTGVDDGTYMNYQNNSSYWVVNSSYIRCKNITLGYSLPDKLLRFQKLISSLRFHIDLENMFTITTYKGLDPEINQNNYYPLSKSYMAGLNITF